MENRKSGVINQLNIFDREVLIYIAVQNVYVFGKFI